MRFTTVAFATGAAAAVAQNGTVPAVYTTQVVTAYTTFCPAPTTLTQGGKTYTVTKATTLTLDCPCTITKPVSSAPVVVPTSAPVVVPSSKPAGVPSSVVVVPGTPSSVVVVPGVPSSVVVVPSGGPAPPASNGTTPTYNAPTGGASTTRPVTTFTGAANKAFAASGAGLAAVFGVAAYVL